MTRSANASVWACGSASGVVNSTKPAPVSGNAPRSLVTTVQPAAIASITAIQEVSAEGVGVGQHRGAAQRLRQSRLGDRAVIGDARRVSRRLVKRLERVQQGVVDGHAAVDLEAGVRPAQRRELGQPGIHDAAHVDDAVGVLQYSVLHAGDRFAVDTAHQPALGVAAGERDAVAELSQLGRQKQAADCEPPSGRSNGVSGSKAQPAVSMNTMSMRPHFRW